MIDFLREYWNNLTIQHLECFALVIVGITSYLFGELWSHGKLAWMYRDDVHPDSFWGDRSYNRKYDRRMIIAPATWYYRFFEIKYKERFPGSATVFVALTDGYHLMQLITLA